MTVVSGREAIVCGLGAVESGRPPMGGIRDFVRRS